MNRVVLGFSVLLFLSSAPFVKAQSTSPSQSSNQMSCKILATSQPWNPPGTMNVSIDDTNVGSFAFDQNGSNLSISLVQLGDIALLSK
jgi:hypothetical protein